MRSHTADRTCRYRYTILTQTKKNMKYTLQVMLLLASCLSSEHMRAHGPEHGTNQLSGRIVDAETNQGIAYAVIQIEGTTLGTATDTAGLFPLASARKQTDYGRRLGRRLRPAKTNRRYHRRTADPARLQAALHGDHGTDRRHGRPSGHQAY
ncbi:carboxypeptidase-like regulatory domain-containing protein [Alistipes ihumii]|uniref:carboxypeptidase-like regulatory domain-containing protein n=1 Tax=Alistipes ihumii TaxID=1470347 RepID=UPI003AB40395